MNKVILVAAVGLASFVATIALGQDPKARDKFVDSTLAAWDKTRSGVQSVECKLKITTTQYARTNPITKKMLYPNDVTTSMIVETVFDFTNGTFSIKRDGEKFSTLNKRVEPYADLNVFKDRKLHSYLKPPDGKATGVGTGSPSGSDLAVFSGNLREYPIAPDVLPLLAQFGIVPLVPTHDIHPENWNKYSAAPFADMILPGSTANSFIATVRVDKDFECIYEVDQASRLRQRTVRYNQKLSEETTFNLQRAAGAAFTGWTRKRYNAGSLIAKEEVLLQELKVNGPALDEVAVPEAKPGMIVAKINTPPDTTGNGNVLPAVDRFRVEPTGEYTEFERRNHPPTSSWRVVTALVACLVILVAAVRLLAVRHKLKT